MNTPAFLKRIGLALSAFWLLASSACGRSADDERPSSAYAQLLRTLYRGTVPLVQPTQLAATLHSNPSSVLLLDTRTPAEYRVSHLQGARFVDFNTFEQAEFAELPRDRTVVVYCSVGYRSERVGERLKALGFRDVRNLYGGIFQWVNDGHPVYNRQGLTQDVHPYSALWSTWLTKGRKVYQ
ncbi:rhodanese-like domain-containing protein [Microvirga sp. STR05]|uniref:rhodanese-like domain-containing protein n=1 Tax=Hymenobacter duratus TaxID=2771356 RepID=UPI001B8C5492|nr:rhodanese-like domain-containing protein [Hymenobacter duratus]MBR7951934.1 rhodanese-like domain-containing protein [Microvirga sp. STR05]